ncbi:MAG: SixA phosphatase family protein [Streptosporangiaceae bacterium]
MVKLLLLRHAKSAWPDVSDHERPLAPRGRRDAPAVGRWLLVAGHLPGEILCSTAVRARETWQLAQAELGTAAPVRFEESVYQATAEGLLTLIRQTAPGVGTLLVVGHDPAIPQLALTLAKKSASVGQGGAKAGKPELADPLRRMQVKFPTAAVAVLESLAAWPQLGSEQARLLEFITPRDISGASSGLT